MPTNPLRTPLPDNDPPPENSPLLVVSAIMNPILASAADTELGSAYYNCQDRVNLHIILKEMAHKQPPTLVVTYNLTAACITNKSVKQRRPKAADMLFYWVKDRIEQVQFIIFCNRGSYNLAD